MKSSENLSKKHALIIAGGLWQVPLISFLKNKNIRISVVDPYTFSPGVTIADQHIIADVRNIDQVIDAINGQVFNYVISDQSDIAVETVSSLASYLNLKGNDIASVRKYSNKLISREFASQNNIPIPDYLKASSMEEVISAIHQIGLPVIIKPVDSQSSRGIFKIDETNLEKAKEFALVTFSESRADHILIESFFEGIELTVEGICSGKKHRTLAISKKKHFRTGIASDLEYPANISNEVLESITKINDHYVETSGLDFGITHAEYLFNEKTEKFILVEIACRGGGSLISSDITKWVSGVDSYEILYKDLLGERTDVKALPLLRRNAILHFFEYKNGKVENIEGLEAIEKIPGVLRIKLDFKIGDTIQAATDDRSRQGFVIIFAESKALLDEKLAHVNNLLKVELSDI